MVLRRGQRRRLRGLRHPQPRPAGGGHVRACQGRRSAAERDSPIGTKTPASEERWAPIQAAYEPWLEKALRHCESPEDFLLPGAPGQLANVSTVSGAFATVLVACDRKRAGERYEIFRGTNMSMALAAGISADQIAVFAGHEIVGDPLMSGHYLRWQALVGTAGPGARNYVPDLGTPDKIEARAREALRAVDLIRFDC